MSSFSSHKWISATTNGKLVVEDPVDAISCVGDSPVGLISIFGRARQGKSFLMNCLSGEQEVFRVSNEKESVSLIITLSSDIL